MLELAKDQMAKIIYRRSCDKDLGRIIDLLESVRGDRRNIGANDFLVAAKGDEILGCARIQKMIDDSLELTSVAVQEQYRGKGIGAKLVSMLLEQESRRPIYLMCRKTNEKFYEHLGFYEIDPKELPAVIFSVFLPCKDRLAELGVAGAAMKLN